MPGSFSDYLENFILDRVFGSVAFTQPAQYVALYTAAPTDAGGGTEVTTSGTAYARLEIEAATGRTWTTASAGAIENAQEWAYPQATASYGTVVAFGVVDTASGANNLLAWGDLSVSKAVDNGDTAKFAIGAIDITLD